MIISNMLSAVSYDLPVAVAPIFLKSLFTVLEDDISEL